MSDNAAWRKASASAAQGNCVELRPLPGGVAMRDSKAPEGPVLQFDAPEFGVFLDIAKGGTLDGLASAAQEES